MTLAADVYSPLDLPPLTNSAMDGYAVRSEDIAGAGPDSPQTLKVIGPGGRRQRFRRHRDPRNLHTHYDRRPHPRRRRRGGAFRGNRRGGAPPIGPPPGPGERPFRVGARQQRPPGGRGRAARRTGAGSGNAHPPLGNRRHGLPGAGKGRRHPPPRGGHPGHRGRTGNRRERPWSGARFSTATASAWPPPWSPPAASPKSWASPGTTWTTSTASCPRPKAPT